ncbi:MAG: AraC family transcriptional regulator [Alphaproteobacteria bacterium]|nr:MAG: AraC family transcriptional regulator [Alphaproteobacteria bacterium]
MIESFDTTVRLMSMGASLLLLIVLMAGQVRTPIKISLVGLLLSAIAYLVNSSTTLTPPEDVRRFVDLVSLFTPFWTWFFGRNLFEVEPPRWILWPAVVSLIASWFAAHFLTWTDPVGFYVIHAVSLLLVADLLRVAIGERADDLLEKRRMIRLWLPFLFAVQSGGVLIFETIVGRMIPYPPIQLTNALLILALTLFAGLALLRTDEELLAEPASDTGERRNPDELSASENVLKQNLENAMALGFYRTAGLTITGLAEHLGVPEHRLRALINRRMGHRNFSAFLNRHRIAEACEILSDRAQVDLPVLTIAMDLGYNSLPTFNRAFRVETGTTPSDYRRDALAVKTVQN